MHQLNTYKNQLHAGRAGGGQYGLGNINRSGMASSIFQIQQLYNQAPAADQAAIMQRLGILAPPQGGAGNIVVNGAQIGKAFGALVTLGSAGYTVWTLWDSWTKYVRKNEKLRNKLAAIQATRGIPIEDSTALTQYDSENSTDNNTVMLPLSQENMIKNQLYNVVNYILENPKSSADYRVINLINSKVSDILGKGGVVSRTPDGHKQYVQYYNRIYDQEKNKFVEQMTKQYLRNLERTQQANKMVLSSDNSSGSNVRSNQSKQIYANKKRELIGKSFMGRGGTRKRRANTTLLQSYFDQSTDASDALYDEEDYYPNMKWTADPFETAELNQMMNGKKKRLSKLNQNIDYNQEKLDRYRGKRLKIF